MEGNVKPCPFLEIEEEGTVSSRRLICEKMIADLIIIVDAGRLLYPGYKSSVKNKLT